jgi:heat shock protein HtpX
MNALWNNTKTMLLLLVLFGLLVWVGSFWGTQGMIVAGVIGVVMNFGAWFFSDTIAIAAMRGQQVHPDSAGGRDLYAMVERLSQRAGLPMPKVYVCPHEAPNAFATGRSPRKAAVAVTHGALQLLDQDELEGVMAHELAHIKNRDTLISTVAATIAGIFGMLAQWAFLFGGGTSGGRREGGGIALIVVIFMGLIGATLIRLAISRSREYVADADGAAIAGSSHGLASALRKLESFAQRIPLHNPNPAMNNMFIVEPFMGQSITNLFRSHPPTEKRIAALLGTR